MTSDDDGIPRSRATSLVSFNYDYNELRLPKICHSIIWYVRNNSNIRQATSLMTNQFCFWRQSWVWNESDQSRATSFAMAASRIFVCPSENIVNYLDATWLMIMTFGKWVAIFIDSRVVEYDWMSVTMAKLPHPGRCAGSDVELLDCRFKNDDDIRLVHGTFEMTLVYDGNVTGYGEFLLLNT